MNRKDLRIVFLGTPEFAVESLRRLVDGGYNIVGVVTMPDKPAGRGHRMFQSPVKLFAVEHGIKVMQPVKLSDESFVAELRSLHADLFIVIAFRMLPRVVWQMPPLGTFNLHASLLPRYRGAAPINWAVINGDEKTGVTTFFLKHELDTGDIIGREEIGIGPDENVGSVHDRLMELGAAMTIKTVDAIIDGTVNPMPQSAISGEKPTAAPKIFKETTCRIDWNKPARDVHNLVRGLSPYPAAWTEISTNETLKIFETRITDIKASDPGAVTTDGKRLTVDCADKRIEILSLQPQGKKRMDADAWLRGLREMPDRFR